MLEGHLPKEVCEVLQCTCMTSYVNQGLQKHFIKSACHPFDEHLRKGAHGVATRDSEWQQ